MAMPLAVHTVIKDGGEHVAFAAINADAEEVAIVLPKPYADLVWWDLDSGLNRSGAVPVFPRPNQVAPLDLFIASIGEGSLD